MDADDDLQRERSMTRINERYNIFYMNNYQRRNRQVAASDDQPSRRFMKEATENMTCSCSLELVNTVLRIFLLFSNWSPNREHHTDKAIFSFTDLFSFRHEYSQYYTIGHARTHCRFGTYYAKSRSNGGIAEQIVGCDPRTKVVDTIVSAPSSMNEKRAFAQLVDNTDMGSYFEDRNNATSRAPDWA